MRERPPIVGGSGSGAGTVGREVALERGGGEELVMGERTRVSVTFERLGQRRGREGKRRGEQRGGPAVGGCHTARGRSWGLAPTVSWPVVTRARRAWAARRCSDRGTSGANGWAPVAVRTGREQRGVCGARGLAREENGVAEPR
jgi:hypothetical protein